MATFFTIFNASVFGLCLFLTLPEFGCSYGKSAILSGLQAMRYSLSQGRTDLKL